MTPEQAAVIDAVEEYLNRCDAISAGYEYPDPNQAVSDALDNVIAAMRRLRGVGPAPDPNQPALFEDTAPGQEPAAVNPLLAGRVTTGASYKYPTIDLGDW